VRFIRVSLCRKRIGVYIIKIGIIGYGSMGSMLIDGFISSGKCIEEQIIVSTRTICKLNSLKQKWDKIEIARDNIEVAQKAKVIFICVKPYQIEDILKEIKVKIASDTHVISTNSFVSIRTIENIVKCKVTKISPSLTSEVREGITLVCHGKSVNKEDANYIESLLNGIGKVKLFKENEFELADKFTSCGPGLIAAIFDELVKSGVKKNGNISKEDVEELVIQTLLGTAILFREKRISFEEMIERVATKGGITEEGIKVLRRELPDVFNEMLNESIEKSREISDNVNGKFE